MNFKLKSDTICIIRYRLEEIYYLKSVQSTVDIVSRPTLFVLTKKFTNKQLQLYKQLPVDDNKNHKISLEIHEAVLLKSILCNVLPGIENHYSNFLMNKFTEELSQTTAF